MHKVTVYTLHMHSLAHMDTHQIDTDRHTHIDTDHQIDTDRHTHIDTDQGLQSWLHVQSHIHTHTHIVTYNVYAVYINVYTHTNMCVYVCMRIHTKAGTREWRRPMGSLKLQVIFPQKSH